VSRLSASCLAEANWWRLIAEWNRLEAERTEGNQFWSAISKVRNNIGWDIPLDVPNQNIGGCVPGIPGGVDASA